MAESEVAALDLTGWRIADPDDRYEIKAGPFRCREDADGALEFVLAVAADHCNSAGIVHGGLMMTMADLVASAVTVQHRPGEFALTISMTHNFLAPARIGDVIRGRAEVRRQGASIAFTEVRLATAAGPILTASAVIKRAPRAKVAAHSAAE